MANSVTFQTLLSAFGNNTGIEVPADVIASLGAGKRPAVLVNVNGYEYRNTVGVMGGKSLVSVSAAVRNATGLAAGDAIEVTLSVADSPQLVEVPADLDAAFAGHPGTREFFDGLSNSLQRYHIDQINGAKSDDTRSRRVAKVIELFLAGKPR